MNRTSSKQNNDKVARNRRWNELHGLLLARNPDMKVKDLEAEVGFSHGSICCFVSGSRTPTWTTLEKIEKYLEA